MVKTSRFTNGLTVLKVPQTDTETITVLVLCKVGSRYESKEVNGVSHFVEHLMFKGTEKRPTTLDLSKELDRVGAEYNAFTAKDHTGYYIKINRENQELALDMLSDMLFNSKFDKDEITRERGVIVEEINLYQDNPLLYCDELLERLLFKATHPLGRLISGPKKNIRNISRAQIMKYKSNYYFPSNMVIAVAGRVDSKTDKLLKKYFTNNLKTKKTVKYKKFTEHQNKPQVLLYNKATEQIQLGLGFPTFSAKHKDVPALGLLAIIMGGNMSSRMFINIREKKGLCYFVKADFSAYQDSGILSVRAGLDKSRIEEAILAIVSELKDVVKNGVTAEELKNAKTFLKGKISLDLEDSSSVANWYGRQKLLRDELKTPQQKLKEYNKVTNKDIIRVAKNIIDIKKSNLVLIGPYKDKNKFYKLLK